MNGDDNVFGAIFGSDGTEFGFPGEFPMQNNKQQDVYTQPYDKESAGVYLTGAKDRTYVLWFKDHTHANHVRPYTWVDYLFASYPPDKSSADFILERPGTGQYDLRGFGTWYALSAHIDGTPLSSFPDLDTTMHQTQASLQLYIHADSGSARLEDAYPGGTYDGQAADFHEVYRGCH